MPDPASIEILQQEIDTLNKQAWTARVVQYDKAFELSQEALHLAESIGYKKGMAEALRLVGFTYMRRGKPQEALPQLNEALRLFQELQDQHGESDVYEYMGGVQRMLNDYGSSLSFLYKSLELRQSLQYREGEVLSHYHLGVSYKYLGNFEKALEHLLQSLSLARAIPYELLESYSLNMIGMVYFETGAYPDALRYFQQSLPIRQREGDSLGEAGSLDNIGLIHFKMGNHEAALDFCSRALALSETINDRKGQGNALLNLSTIYQHLGQNEKALDCCRRSLNIRNQLSDKRGEAEALLFLVQLQIDAPDMDNRNDLFELLHKAGDYAGSIGAMNLVAQMHFCYYQLLKQGAQFAEALFHLEKYGELEKSLQRDALAEKVQKLEVMYKAEQSRKEAEIFRLRNIELVNLYEEGKKQKDEIEAQKNRAERTLAELKATQQQLVQKEKMASLGELTAGIAHEIQNPLNFVNNFSEINAEMVNETEALLQKGQKEEAVVSLGTIKLNAQKIVYHGKRAEAIVRNMLLHSRSGTGAQEPTNINALADEYLRLSYHGFRARENAFQVQTITRFDKSIGLIPVVPQEIGRVLLNLFNNAFYAVDERKKQRNGQYEPLVSVSTRRVDNHVEISVKDNGTGIPENVLNKIYQPFFTTKPSGEGTGLGLSLSYDIITKGHSGELLVETEEGKGAAFIIRLPGLNQKTY